MRWPRPWRAMRAAVLIRPARRVAPRALAQARLAKVPTAAQQVAADGGECEPSGVGGEGARWQMREGAVGPAGEDLLGLDVAAVLLLGPDSLERRVGEDDVVAPGGEQLALPGSRFAAEVLHAADDRPAGHCLPLGGGEGRVFRLRDLGVRDPAR